MNYESQLSARIAASSVGNPHRQMANDARITYPLREVRVLKDGWYHDRTPVKVGHMFKMLLPDALGARALGRVEFVV